MKKLLILTLLALFAFSCALAQIPDVYDLEPVSIEGDEGTERVPLYAGPTRVYARVGEETIDLEAPLVFFGQSDSWIMVANGTPEHFGAVGWIEASSLTTPLEPELTFDPLEAMVEEDAPLTFFPREPEAEPVALLKRGDMVSILGRWEEMLYVEWEAEAGPVRAFVRESAIE